MKKLGVIVNPVAGLGGRVALKGSDGLEILRRARELGALPQAPARAVEALQVVARVQDVGVLTYPREMGQDECLAAGISPRVLGHIQSGETTPRDTRQAAHDLAEAGVDLLLFAGGDGTARDVCEAVGEKLPALGIPAGVKIHSAVYAVTPRAAGEVAARFLEGQARGLRLAEVMDIDEDAFRAGAVKARLFGYLSVPVDSRYVQGAKAGAVQAEQDALRGIARDVVEAMEPGTLYIIGPGTTTRAIMEELGLPNTLLGVDLVRDRRVVANDVSEADLLRLIAERPAKIVVTAIGGQGHVFGRGNQQISPRVIRAIGARNLVVVATIEKLMSLSGRPLLVDTGDEELNQELCGYMRVTTGYRECHMCRVGW